MAESIDSGEDLYRLLQGTYFDAIDAGEPATAARALHEDVEWSHRQVWEHDGHGSDTVDTLVGRESVVAFLASRIEEMQAIGIEHEVKVAICEGTTGAFTASVVGPDGRRQPFLGWVELADALVSTYRVTPE